MIFNEYVLAMATGWALATAAVVLFLAMFGQSIGRRGDRMIKSPLSRVDKKVRTAAIIAFGLEFCLVWFLIWFVNPSMVGLFSGPKMLLLISCVSIMIGGWLSGSRVAREGLILLAILAVWPVTEVIVTEIRHSSDFAALAQITVLPADQKLPEADLAHVPVVNAKMAQKRITTDNSLAGGRLSSGQISIDVGAWNMQPVSKDKHLWLVAPASYDSCISQKEVPGFMAIDAENPSGKMVWHDAHIKYATGGCFSDNLNRYLYLHGYTNGYLMNARFMVDDNWRPYYVVNWVKPAYGPASYGVIGYKSDKTLVVDAQTGAILSPNAIKFAVDVTFSQDVAKDYITDYGSAKQNAKPADDQPQLQFGSPGQAAYIATMRSTKNEDKVTVGVVSYDTKSTSGKYYPGLAGIHVGDDVINAFKNSPANVKHWGVGKLQLVTIHGVTTWFAVYESVQTKEMSWYAGVGFLEAHHAAAEDVQMDGDKEVALVKYQDYLATESQAGRIPYRGEPDQSVSGTVFRVGAPAAVNNTQIVEVAFNNDTRTFRVPLSLVGATLVRDGDQVTVKFYSTSQKVVFASSFDDANLASRQSPLPPRK